MQAGRLAHALRRDHHAPAIEDRHQRQLEPPDDVEQARRVVGVGVDETRAGLERDSLAAQCVDEEAWHRGRERRRPIAGREVQDGAVLGDHGVDEVQLAGDAAKVVENPPGDKQDHDAAPPDDGNRFAHLGLQYVTARDGAVEVQCDHRQFHRPLSMGRTCAAGGADSAASWRRTRRRNIRTAAGGAPHIRAQASSALTAVIGAGNNPRHRALIRGARPSGLARRARQSARTADASSPRERHSACHSSNSTRPRPGVLRRLHEYPDLDC